MVPNFVESNYLKTLKQICLKEHIDFIIPNTDRDSNYFSENKMIKISLKASKFIKEKGFFLFVSGYNTDFKKNQSKWIILYNNYGRQN